MIVTDLEFLRKKSLPVEKLEDAKPLIDELLRVAISHKSAIGLSAVQIGTLERVCVCRFSKNWTVFINPEIIVPQKPIWHPVEMCLSLPGIRTCTTRFYKIIFKAANYNLEEDTKMLRASGLEALILQHELDHMDGILMTDREWKPIQKGRNEKITITKQDNSTGIDNILEIKYKQLEEYAKKGWVWINE